MSIKTGRQIREGTCFVVPLSESRSAVGVVARRSPSRGRPWILLCYFFGPYAPPAPVTLDGLHLSAKNATSVFKCSALYLHEGKWPILGQLKPWIREKWPMIAFSRYDHIKKKTFMVIYHEDDPNHVVIEYPDQGYGLPTDSMAGSAAAEIRLAQLFDQRKCH